MTDDLLDRARQLADDYRNLDEGRVLWGLIERVQQAEAALVELAPADEVEVEGLFFQRADLPRVLGNFMRSSADYAREAKALGIERDAARGKLDKVRDWAHHIRTTRERGDFEYNAACDVLAIIDGKTGD